MEPVTESFFDYLKTFNKPTIEKYELAAAGYEANYAKFLPENLTAKILDVGCGMGHFLYYLKKKGYKNFIGIDVGKKQVNFCKKHFTKETFVANAFEYLKRSSNEFDAIVMNDLIEHIPKLQIINLLEHVNKSLKKDGVLIIKTINMDNIFGSHSRYRDYTHENGYNEFSLFQILKATKFQDIAFFPEIIAKVGIKRRLGSRVRNLSYLFIKLAYLVDRGRYPNILTPNLIALAKKS